MFTSSWCSFCFVTSDWVKQPFVLFSNEQYLHRAFLARKNHNYFMSLRQRGRWKLMPLVDTWTGNSYVLFLSILSVLMHLNKLAFSLPFLVDACWAESRDHRGFCGAEQTLDHPPKYLDILSMNYPSALILKWCETSPCFLIGFATELCHCFEGREQKKDIPLNPAGYFSYNSVPQC